MRRLICGLLLAGVASPVVAADLDLSWLRGSSSFPADPPTYARWSGLYGGGQIGEDFRGVDFSNSGTGMISDIAGQDANFAGIPLNSFTQLSKLNTAGPSFGGFIGYNYQIDDVVAGIEFNFSRSAVQARASDTASRGYWVTPGGAGGPEATTYTVTNAGTATVNDYGTIRARFGWAYGNFLPYAFGGMSVAQIDTSRSVNVNYHSTTCPLAPLVCIPIGGNYTEASGSHGKWVAGFDAGVGLDYAVTRNVFLRGELEYIQLGNPNSIKINNATARVGAGLKF